MADDLTLKGDVIGVVSSINDPVSQTSILDAHMLESVDVTNGKATIELRFPEAYDREARWDVEDAVHDAVSKVEGIGEVAVKAFIPDAPAGKPAPATPVAPKRGPAGKSPIGGGSSAPSPASLRGVGRVIAVASGKGGVGKSTVAVNLALALSSIGYRVGLLDIDIYGPSLPTLLGVSERPSVKEKRIIPLEVAGLKLMSLGFLMDEDTPVIWRGPIVTGIIRQFLQDVDWEGTDYLIVDMPPGTGDAQLSLAQTVPVDGAVIVTTPSDLALVDAARGLKMFHTLNVDVIGLVENMAYYTWPGETIAREVLATLRESNAPTAPLDTLQAALDAHARLYIFGQGGGRREAERLDTPFLGEIPLDGDVRRGGDEGRPVVLADPESPVARAFVQLAERVAEAKPVGDDVSGPKKGLFSFLKS